MGMLGSVVSSIPDGKNVIGVLNDEKLTIEKSKKKNNMLSFSSYNRKLERYIANSLGKGKRKRLTSLRGKMHNTFLSKSPIVVRQSKSGNHSGPPRSILTKNYPNSCIDDGLSRMRLDSRIDSISNECINNHMSNHIGIGESEDQRCDHDTFDKVELVLRRENHDVRIKKPSSLGLSSWIPIPNDFSVEVILGDKGKTVFSYSEDAVKKTGLLNENKNACVVFGSRKKIIYGNPDLLKHPINFKQNRTPSPDTTDPTLSPNNKAHPFQSVKLLPKDILKDLNLLENSTLNNPVKQAINKLDDSTSATSTCVTEDTSFSSHVHQDKNSIENNQDSGEQELYSIGKPFKSDSSEITESSSSRSNDTEFSVDISTGEQKLYAFDGSSHTLVDSYEIIVNTKLKKSCSIDCRSSDCPCCNNMLNNESCSCSQCQMEEDNSILGDDETVSKSQSPAMKPTESTLESDYSSSFTSSSEASDYLTDENESEEENHQNSGVTQAHSNVPSPPPMSHDILSSCGMSSFDFTAHRNLQAKNVFPWNKNTPSNGITSLEDPTQKDPQSNPEFPIQTEMRFNTTGTITNVPSEEPIPQVMQHGTTTK